MARTRSSRVDASPSTEATSAAPPLQATTKRKASASEASKRPRTAAAARRKSSQNNSKRRPPVGKPKAPPRLAAVAGGVLRLCDVGERGVISFLPYLPDRARAERVCKRWYRLSREEVPIRDIDFAKISTKKVTKNHLKMVLLRANGALESASLPGFSLDDACLNALKTHTNLKHLRVYSLSRAQLFDLLSACIAMQSIELLDCKFLNFTRWVAHPAKLQSIHLNACHTLKTPAVSTMIVHCGDKLKQLVLTGAENVTSSIFNDLARHSTKIEEVAISYSRTIRLDDLQALTSARWLTLRLLDLSCCAGFQGFPDATVLTAMEVLILDNTGVSDEGLRAISTVTPQLKYLSLQDCRNITDQGLVDFSAPAEGRSRVELLDLKGTRLSNVGVEALEAGISSLRMLRLDSCRNVSRVLRLRRGERTRQFLQRPALNQYERLAVARIATPEQIDAAPAADDTDQDAEEGDEEDSDDLYEDY